MDIKHLCLECMSDKQTEGACPSCGWDGSKPDEPSICLKRGTILNKKYVLGKVLGHGGFGITYLAWDMVFKMKVAIKEYLQSELATRGPENTISVFSGAKAEQFKYGKEKFLEEARTIAKLDSHEGIVSVRDYFEENNTAYFVMKYLDGVTLKEYLDKNGGKLDWHMAYKIMMPVLDGLREVHRAGILHRDISPDNIYITHGGQVKILDFGAARYAIGKHSQSLSVVLKPGYAPEEQYRNKGNQGPWTDVYAVSACLYRTIMGERPPEALDRLDGDVLKSPSSMGISLPSHVEAVIMKGLAIRLSNRFQTIQDFQNALQHGDIGAPPPLPVPPPPLSNGNGFIGRLANGDFGLPMTYWVFGVLIGFVVEVAVLITIGLDPSKDLETIPLALGSFAFIFILLLGFTVYQFPVIRGTWRAADRHKGSKFWPFMAKTFVFMRATILSFVLAYAIRMFLDSGYVFNEYRDAVKTELENFYQAEQAHYTEYGFYAKDVDSLGYEQQNSDLSLLFIDADDNCFRVSGSHDDDTVWYSIDCNGTFSKDE